MLIAAAALLEKNHNPSEEDIKKAISGNICRCTGYVKIIESVQHAARLQNRSRAAPGRRVPGKR